MNAAAATGAIVAGLALLAGPARADREEWRVAVIGSGLVVATETLGASGDGVGIGGRARVGYGLWNPLELALFLGYSRTQALKFAGAQDGGQRGTLYADIEVASTGVELRLELGVETWRFFERLHPFLSLRGGLMARRLSGQALLNDRDMTLLAPADDIHIAPAWGGSLGLAHRFGNHLLVSLVADALFADVTSEKALGLEVAWAWYGQAHTGHRGGGRYSQAPHGEADAPDVPGPQPGGPGARLRDPRHLRTRHLGHARALQHGGCERGPRGARAGDLAGEVQGGARGGKW